MTDATIRANGDASDDFPGNGASSPSAEDIRGVLGMLSDSMNREDDEAADAVLGPDWRSTIRRFALGSSPGDALIMMPVAGAVRAMRRELCGIYSHDGAEPTREMVALIGHADDIERYVTGYIGGHEGSRYESDRFSCVMRVALSVAGGDAPKPIENGNWYTPAVGSAGDWARFILTFAAAFDSPDDMRAHLREVSRMDGLYDEWRAKTTTESR